MTAAADRLTAAGITDSEMQTVTGFGLRRLADCKADDTILNKYTAGALTLEGVLVVLGKVER